LGRNFLQRTIQVRQIKKRLRKRAIV
jgi:hypothetical protein